MTKGGLQFENITDKANIRISDKWCTGVSMIDINQDGLLDIYISSTSSYRNQNKNNLLYINQGIDKNGIPIFKESASQVGLNDNGYTIHTAFFDYDNDGDLDAYLLNNTQKDTPPNVISPKQNDGTAVNCDRLYQNISTDPSKPMFKDVSKDAGILLEGFGLGVAVQDINQDGWIDIYVTNDYLSNDILYINNKNGTFTDKASPFLKHTSFSAMGNDVSDFNNDGLLDIVAVDMLPEGNKERKLMLGGRNHDIFEMEIINKYDPQYMRNTLQLNNGVLNNGDVSFSEIGQLAGVSETNWSWAPLFADFDNDGFRDLFITNGYPRDITNMDFVQYRISGMQSNAPQEELNKSLLQNVKDLQGFKVANYIFKNNGDLTFKDNTRDWGINTPSFSNGAAYADLDLDGDLDLVINNINEIAHIYENQLINTNVKINKKNNYLALKLKGSRNNRQGLGAKVSIKYQGKHQFYENSPYRGYQSSVDDNIHFGLGHSNLVDTVLINWPDGKSEIFSNIKSNQTLVVDHAQASIIKQSKEREEMPFFQSMQHNIDFTHKESLYIDFRNQPLLPNKLSQNGPGIAIGDINGDKLEDFIVGGAFNQSAKVFLQQANQSFKSHDLSNDTKYQEDMGLLLFDADMDKDLDLYIVSGGSEFDPLSPYYQDRLYVNDGKGSFTISTDALPYNPVSGSVVVSSDFDADGDLDLFIGGRCTPNQYPLAGNSILLENQTTKKGYPKFVDITDQSAPGMKDIGMVCSALFSDFNQDNKMDLILVGEWMPVTFFLNTGNKFVNVTSKMGRDINSSYGWWNSISAGDFDNDGDTDYVAGNLGINSKLKASLKQPVLMYYKDFNDDGRMDPILTYNKDNKVYPFALRNELNQQLPLMRRKFQTYTDYANATLADVFSNADLKDARMLRAVNFKSCVIQNNSSAKNLLPNYSVKPLPIQAQFAPVYGIILKDLNNDDQLDLLLTGNSYAPSSMIGRYDALPGLMLTGNGMGDFTPINLTKSGFFIDKDVKGFAELTFNNGTSVVLAAQNNDRLKSLKFTGKQQVFKVESDDAWAEIRMNNGQVRRQEFYYGNNYLSQSSRSVFYSNAVESITVTKYSGIKRQVKL